LSVDSSSLQQVLSSPLPELVFARLQQGFASGRTRPIAWRAEKLRLLEEGLRARESDLQSVLTTDLEKPEFESFLSEFAILCEELREARRELARWAAPKRLATPLKLWPARCEWTYEPKGAVCIIAPWNYPIQLALAPLIAAIAAGNTVCVKMSEFAPASARFVHALIREIFADDEVIVVEGDGPWTSQLLDRPWAHVFFTGSTAVGKAVAQVCARHLTPTTLELGGKSPCIVDATTNLEVAARRAAWGRFFNAGQTCVAPDYILVEDQVAEAFTRLLIKEVRSRGESAGDSARLIHHKHAERLRTLLKGCEILTGGAPSAGTDPRRWPPTLVRVPEDAIVRKHALLHEEIFGPIFPILNWSTREELRSHLARNPDPLACYVFSEDQSFVAWLLEGATGKVHPNFSFGFGGGVLNDVMAQFGSPELPFGGRGASGMGAYHGEFGYMEFSQRRTWVVRRTWGDLALRYPPYSNAWKRWKAWLA
jgi:aldehyde dehydrogenase (NAD+)